jgi:hypothetical protein
LPAFFYEDLSYQRKLVRGMRAIRFYQRKPVRGMSR